MAEDKGDKKDDDKQNGKDTPNSESDSEHSHADSGGSSGDKGEGSEHGNTSIREMVREEIQSALKDLKQPAANGSQPRMHDIEAAAEKMVKDAATRLEEQKKHEQEHEDIRKIKDKPVAEEAPKKVRKLTKLLWGDGD